MARVRKVFDDHNVAFQTAELGKVDVGGGGTIAYIAALYGMEVIDSGVAVLSMHSPWEVTSKADIYEAKKAYKAFLPGCLIRDGFTVFPYSCHEAVTSSVYLRGCKR